MNYHRFLSLAGQLLSLIDNGKKLDISATHKQIREKTIFGTLTEQFGSRIDVSSFTKKEQAEMMEFFGTLSQVVDERRKMGVEHNGLCLLLAYCIEAMEENPETIQSKD
jgi:hypothetical protein